MTHFFTKRSIKAKISKLNRTIDNKILEGKSYRRESRMHKMLRNELNMLSRA